MPTKLETAVVIVNYNSGNLVVECLKSLEQERADYGNITVYVCDNCSPDESADTIEASVSKHQWSDWVKLSRLNHNGGFAAGNNAVLNDLTRTTKAQYIWLLNPDTIVRPGALKALITYMDANPQVGITGSRLEDFDGTTQACAFRFHTAASEFESSSKIGIFARLLDRWRVSPDMPDKPTPADWVSGASMMLRSDALREIGLFDETYFLYYEETDLCHRMHDKAWQVHHVPDSRVVHLVGHSTLVTKRGTTPPRRPSYWFQSRRHYFVKHHGRLYALGADLALASGTVLGRIKGLIKRSPTGSPPLFLYDLFRHNPFLHVASKSRVAQDGEAAVSKPNNKRLKSQAAQGV